jgi:Sensors of blue-light using FAD
MSMIRIVYYSERTPSVGIDMRRLLDTCERNNVRDGIGGFLHYNGVYFLQVLEGERDVVRACYQRISADGAHTNLVLIGAEEIAARKFESWTMGLGAGLGNPTKETFLANFAASKVDPAVMGAD